MRFIRDLSDAALRFDIAPRRFAVGHVPKSCLKIDPRSGVASGGAVGAGALHAGAARFGGGLGTAAAGHQEVACGWMCVDVCMDMRTDLCMDACTDMYVDMCIEVSVDMWQGVACVCSHSTSRSIADGLVTKISEC